MAEKQTIVGEQGPSAPRKMEVDFPSNSHKSREQRKGEPEKKIEKVISGNVVQKKKGLGKRIAETFIEDDVGNVFSYILHEVLIPAAKATLWDMISGGSEMLLFKDARGSRSRRERDRGRTYVSYNSYSSNDRSSLNNRSGGDRRDMPNRDHSRHNFDDIILETRGEAEDVIDHLIDLIDEYKVASVADLYELVGLTGSFTDNNYGWTNLSTAQPRRVRDGYLLDLPRPMPLD
jgi:hypothetical protein